MRADRGARSEQPGARTNERRALEAPGVGTAPHAVELHIAELVLHGIAPGGRYAIADAVERELAQLIGERGVPMGLPVGGGTDRVDGREMKLARGSDTQAIGIAVAEAVYGSLAR